MDSFVLILIAATAVCIKGQEQEIEVYEIRKAKDDLQDFSEHDDTELRIDNDYYNPDGLFDRLHKNVANLDASFEDRSVDIVANSLIKKLKKIVKSRNRNRKDKRDDDYIASFRDIKDEDIFDDNDRTPLVIVADRNVLYHLIPKRTKHRNKMDSVLRSIDDDTEVENRTAPPRIKINFDYDY